MRSKHHFTFDVDWRIAPGAFWVHLPVENEPGTFVPPAPPAVPHKGFAMLHVEFEAFDLVFSSLAQIEHYIQVLSKSALPTSRQLSELRGHNVGPSQHWLSRLPGELKSPRSRPALVKALLDAKDFAMANSPNSSFKPVR